MYIFQDVSKYKTWSCQHWRQGDLIKWFLCRHAFATWSSSIITSWWKKSLSWIGKKIFSIVEKIKLIFIFTGKKTQMRTNHVRGTNRWRSENIDRHSISDLCQTSCVHRVKILDGVWLFCSPWSVFQAVREFLYRSIKFLIQRHISPVIEAVVYLFRQRQYEFY